MPSKHENFVRGPIDEKDVSELPGVGKAAQTRLATLGFSKCYQLLGKYMGETEQKFDAFLLEAALTKKNAEACKNAIKEYLENEKRNFRDKTNTEQPNVMQELVSGLNAQKLREDSPTKSGLQEAAKTPLELWKSTFAEILEKMETIPEGEQKTLFSNYKKHLDSLISDTEEIRKMHNKENIK